jgi:AcrR family transcriptional regulator
MGRRSSHTAEELRELILVAAREIIEREGLAGLSARTIAKRIGYSPGTLYNVFQNLDELILHVEARLLDELDEKLATAERELGPAATLRDRISAFATTYMAFTQKRPRLWNLLFEHQLPADASVPQWYRSRLDGLLARVEIGLVAGLPGRDPAALRRSARVLWAGVHGITSLATADKLSTISADSAGTLIDDLVDNYLSGIQS